VGKALPPTPTACGRGVRLCLPWVGLVAAGRVLDAGSDHISKSIRRFRDRVETHSWLRLVTNLEPEMYLKILANADVAVGNSSSFVRDAGYFGTPVVLVGNRQIGRERGAHVMAVPPLLQPIINAIRIQRTNGRYAPSDTYGDGFVTPRIISSLKRLKHYSQKQLNYSNEIQVNVA